MPKMSTMLPNSVTVGEKSIFKSDRRRVDEFHCDHRRAEHRDFCFLGHSKQLRRKMKSARHHQARDLALAQAREIALRAALGGRLFRYECSAAPEHLNAFLGEISVEPGKRETGTVDRRLANFPMKAYARPFQLHVQLLSMRIVKAFNRNNRDAFLLIACRCNRLDPASFRH